MKLDYDEFAVYVCGRYGISMEEAKTGCTFMEMGKHMIICIRSYRIWISQR